MQAEIAALQETAAYNVDQSSIFIIAARTKKPKVIFAWALFVDAPKRSYSQCVTFFGATGFVALGVPGSRP